MSKELAIALVVILFMVIPLTIAMPVFLCEFHDWQLKRKSKKAGSR